jgi:hypothetical protein
MQLPTFNLPECIATLKLHDESERVSITIDPTTNRVMYMEIYGSLVDNVDSIVATILPWAVNENEPLSFILEFLELDVSQITYDTQLFRLQLISVITSAITNGYLIKN